jgi:hypothetical protein
MVQFIAFILFAVAAALTYETPLLLAQLFGARAALALWWISVSAGDIPGIIIFIAAYTVIGTALWAVPTTAATPRPSLLEGIARLRAATGKPEKRVVFRMCSMGNESFTVTSERTDPRERSTIALIEKTDPVAGKGIAQAAGAPGAADKAAAFRIEEFDQTGMVCPWYGDRAARSITTHATRISAAACRPCGTDGTPPDAHG